MTIDERLRALRKKMSQNGIDIYIIPSSDPHQSEYVDDHFKSREWISGFTGSAGTVVVSKSHAGLWTDSRYFLQAEDELKNSEFELHKVIDRSYPNFLQYIADNYSGGKVVGCDGDVFSFSQIESYKDTLSEKGIELKTQFDLVAEIWNNRPSLPQDKIFDLPVEYSGISREEKFKIAREIMQDNDADEYLISALDSISWILNARGNDIDFNPVFYSFIVLRKEDALLFIDENKVGDALKKDFADANIKIRPYLDVYSYLGNIEEGTKMMLSSALCNYNLYNSIAGNILDGDDIVSDLKTIKNATEIENIKIAHINDGVSLTKFYIWLENELKTRTVSEFEAGEKIAYFRSIHDSYISESFGAIVGYKENGAIVHYSASKDSCSEIKSGGMLLIDSGGQYLNGTTDITRTIYLGEPSQEERTNFTLVLKGHLSIATLKFPKGTNGYQLDTFARQYLWEHGLNYYHGTGHGVGFFLNVHEGPQGISSVRGERSLTPLLPGMFTSNEPGYYKADHYGIRIENLILTVKVLESEFGEFYGHETITMFPYDKNLIDKAILTKNEVEWINNYHQEIYDNLSPQLTEDERKWLKEKCKEI